MRVPAGGRTTANARGAALRYRRVCVDLSDDDEVLGLSVEWHQTENAGPTGIWCDPSPMRHMDPALAFDHAWAQRHAQLELFD